MREPIIPRLDGAVFLQWEEGQPERFELHSGFVFAFAGGTADHDRIAFNMRSLLERVVKKPRRTFGNDMKVRISDETYYYPDVTVACAEVLGSATVIGDPRIVVEVLSPSTRAYDLVEKRTAYRSLPSLEAYVIVRSESRRVEVDRRYPSSSWRTETVDDGAVTIGGGEIALDAIYITTALSP